MKNIISNILYKGTKEELEKTFINVDELEFEINENGFIYVRFTYETPYTCGARESMVSIIGEVLE